MLKHIITSTADITRNMFETTMCHAAMLIAFFGFLCFGEFTAASKLITSPLLLNDLLIKDNAVHLHIRKSETDQLHKGAQLDIRSAKKQALCLV